MSTALADNYTHLLIIRFFLGVTESPYFPGALFLLSAWYPKKVSQEETWQSFVILADLCDVESAQELAVGGTLQMASPSPADLLFDHIVALVQNIHCMY